MAIRKSLTVIAFIAGFGPAVAQDNLLVIGELVFFVCAPCHLVGEAKIEKFAPHLNDLFGRTPGSVPGYEYSEAMVEFGRNNIWDEATLTRFLKDAQGTVPGTKMPFGGFSKEEEIRALLAYLATFDPDGMAPH
jgi:cytochrome c